MSNRLACRTIRWIEVHSSQMTLSYTRWPTSATTNEPVWYTELTKWFSRETHLLSEPDDPSSILRSHIKGDGGTNSTELSSDRHMLTMVCTHTHTNLAVWHVCLTLQCSSLCCAVCCDTLQVWKPVLRLPSLQRQELNKPLTSYN